MNKNSSKNNPLNSKEKMSLAMAILEERISNGIEIKIPFINFSIKKHENSEEKIPLTNRST